MGILDRCLRREAYFAGAMNRKKGRLSTVSAADGDAATAAPCTEPNQGSHRTKRLVDSRRCYTEVPCYDGYGWRKYGEKAIASTGFNRCYYRCTNSPCPAKKKVEQFNRADPPLYLVTYEEEHTCNLAPSTSHHQVPTPHSTEPAPNSPFLFSSVWPANLQMGQAEQFQFSLTGVKREEESAPEIKFPISSSPGMQTTLPCITTPGPMEVETGIPEYVTSWWSLPPTSPLLATPGYTNQMENYAFEAGFDELPTPSFTAQGSHGETYTLDEGSIANSFFNLPAAPGLMSLGSMSIEGNRYEYAFDEPEHLPPTLSVATQAGHAEADLVDQSDGVITSSDQLASSGGMMATGFVEMGDHESVFLSSPEFEVDYSEISALWELPNFEPMYWQSDPL